MFLMRNKEIWKPGFDRATQKFVDTDLQKPLQLPRCAYTRNHHIRDYLLAVFTRLKSLEPLVRASHLLGADQKLKRIKELYQSLSHPADEILRPHRFIQIVEGMQKRAARNLDYFPQLQQCTSSMRMYIATPNPATADEEAELTRQLTAISRDAEAAMMLTKEAATARKALVKKQFCPRLEQLISGKFYSVFTVVRICLASVNDNSDWEWHSRHAHAQHICNIVGRERQPGQFSNASNLLSMTDEYPAFSRMLQYLTTGKYKAEAFAALQAAIDKEKLLRNQLCPAERHLLIFTPAVLMELFRNDKSDSKISISEQCQAIRRQADLEASILESWNQPALVQHYRTCLENGLHLPILDILDQFVSEFLQHRKFGMTYSYDFSTDVKFTISSAFQALIKPQVFFQDRSEHRASTPRTLVRVPRRLSRSIFNICMEQTRHVRFLEIMRLIDPDALLANSFSYLMIDAPRQYDCAKTMSSRHEQLLQSGKFELLRRHRPNSAICKDFVTFIVAQQLRSRNVQKYITSISHRGGDLSSKYLPCDEGSMIIFKYITAAQGSIADVQAFLAPMMAREQRLYSCINSELGQKFRSKFRTAWGISEELTAKSILRTLPVCRRFVTGTQDVRGSDARIFEALDQVLLRTFREQQLFKTMSVNLASAGVSGAQLFELVRDQDCGKNAHNDDMLSENYVALQGCDHTHSGMMNSPGVFLTTAGRVVCFGKPPWYPSDFIDEFPARSPTLEEIGKVSGYHRLLASKRAEQNRRHEEQNRRQEEQNRRQQAQREKDRRQEAYAASVEKYRASQLKISRKPLTRWEKLVKAGRNKQTN
jgi:hypothetical protein